MSYKECFVHELLFIVNGSWKVIDKISLDNAWISWVLFIFVSRKMVFESPWRDKELKGNPVKVRNYPRSCKLWLLCRRGVATLYKPLVRWRDREGVVTEASQKTCRFLHHSFNAFGWKAIERVHWRFILLLGFCALLYELSLIIF